MKLSVAIVKLEQRVDELESKLQLAIIAKERAQKNAAWYRAELRKVRSEQWIRENRKNDER